MLTWSGVSLAEEEEGKQAIDRRIAVTFDDLPAVNTLEPGVEGQRAVLEPLIETLVSQKVPAVGFVNSGKTLSPDGREMPGSVALLEAWLDAGLELGNHSHSHPSLHSTPVDEWLADVERGETLLRRLYEGRDGELRWFRHPFLHTGRDLETRDRVTEELAGRGIEVAPVSVDNEDYVFAQALQKAHFADDGELERRIEKAYVGYMVEKVLYYEQQARDLFGRGIPQVLLVHANPINARRFGALVEALRDEGYEIVTLEEALADPAYDSEDTVTGPFGISWVHRWALTRGVDREFFGDEPPTPELVAAAAAEEGE